MNLQTERKAWLFMMKKEDILYQNYLQILKEELVPAMGCTEPIAIAYCAAKARDVLGNYPDRVTIEVSGNIVKNVKSVVVPNTDGRKGIETSAAIGIAGGDSSKALQVIASVTDKQKEAMVAFLQNVEISVLPLETEEQLDILITEYAGEHYAKVRIAGFHTNIVLIEKDDEILYQSGEVTATNVTLTDRSLLDMEHIYEFAMNADLTDMSEILDRQINCNMAIAEEGMRNNYGANVGSVLLHAYGNHVQNRAKAMAAAGSDARMSGCEMPVIINSGSGNQGMTASIPVIVYARELEVSKERLYRALILSNLITIHQKTGIGRMSAYCGAISAGCGAGCGIAYLLGGDYQTIIHTLVNSVAIVSGIVCDGAKPSCAAKIEAAVDAGILGYYMYKEGQEFKGGDGIVSKGVENTIHNISRLGKIGMKETDKEIIRIMTNC